MDAPDSISRLIDHVNFRARTFHAGNLGGSHEFCAVDGVGHLHVVRSGCLVAVQPGHRKIAVHAPSLLFYPRPLEHRLIVSASKAVEVLCATVSYGAGLNNAIAHSFPPMMVMPFDTNPRIGLTLSLMFEEGASNQIGRQAILDRLCDALLVLITRHAIEHGLVASGLLAGLAHPRLGRVLVEMLDEPARNWTLDAMAKRAHLSRNAFARLFRTVVGHTPAGFLTQVRIALAQRLLRQGRPLAAVATDAGYSSQPAFSRAFIRETGASPSSWLRQGASALQAAA